MEKKDSDVKITHIGGQAVMEGVMMRGKNCYCVSVRNSSGKISTVKKTTKPLSSKYKFLRWPVIRGIANFVSSMIVGMKVIYDSADMAGLDLEEENPSKLDLWLEKKFGDKLTEYIMTFSVIVSILFSVFVFMLVPVWISSLINPLLQGNTWALGIIEGLVRLAIFLLYIYLISKMKEIKRVFQYHGAEHKTINCYEHNEELTVENVRKYTRLHKRCGTSFLLIVMVVSMIFFLFIKTDVIWIRLLTRIIFVPFIAGFSYEIIKWAGRSDSALVNIISFPGLCLQKITTSEPDDSQMEVAIESMKAVLRDEGEDV